MDGFVSLSDGDNQHRLRQTEVREIKGGMAVHLDLRPHWKR
jgi:hypothetical protein